MGWRDIARRVAPAFVRRRRIAASHDHQVTVAGEPELARLGDFVKSGDLCLDIGANAGVYAWALARLGARVIAFEPNPRMADIVDLLGNPGIEVRRIALSDREGTATLTLPGGDTGLATLGDHHTTGDPAFTVATQRLDDLGLSGVRFIKIDVEGHEEAVLAGAAALIARDQPTLLVEIEERHNSGGLARIVARLAGYSCWFLIDEHWQPLAAFDAAVHQDERAIDPMSHGANRRTCRYYNNFLFVPAGSTPPGTHG